MPSLAEKKESENYCIVAGLPVIDTCNLSDLAKVRRLGCVTGTKLIVLKISDHSRAKPSAMATKLPLNGSVTTVKAIQISPTPPASVVASPLTIRTMFCTETRPNSKARKQFCAFSFL